MLETNVHRTHSAQVKIKRMMKYVTKFLNDGIFF